MGKRIFQLLMKMKNAINIDIHCYWIKKMLNQEFFDVDWLREEIFYDYLCYLLCLWAAIKKKSNDLKDKIETQKIFIEELNLFIDLAITIIGPYVEDVSFCG
jgi:capsule polysaccharide modification protein KpsS